MATMLISPTEANSLLQSLLKLADQCRAQGRYQQAIPLYRSALAQAEASLGAEHSTVAAVLNNLALLYQYTDNFDEAERLSRRARLLAPAQTMNASFSSVANA